jgi:hypothetical protein
MAAEVAVASRREEGARLLTDSSLLVWATGVSVVWMIGGHIDAWYHVHYGFEIESFLTAPHALLYGGWAGMLALPLAYLASHKAGWNWRVLPPGFPLVLLGGVLFGLGGGFDAMWHAVFGFEVRQETLLTPAHQWLNVAFIVSLVGLLWAALHRREQAADRRPLWTEIAVVVALAQLFRAVLWNLFFSEPTVADYATGGAVASHLAGFVGITWRGETAQVAGTTGILLHATLMAAFLIGVLRHLRPPSGTIAAVLVWDGVLTAIVGDAWRTFPAIVLAALIGEIGWAALRRGWLGGPTEPRGYWVLAWAIPAAYVAFDMLFSAVLSGGVVWTAHLVGGIPFLAGLYGLVAGVLIAPPRWARVAVSK